MLHWNAYLSITLAIYLLQCVYILKEKLAPYIDNLLEEAVTLLTGMWGTKRYPIPKDMEAPYLRSVELPKLKNFPPAPIEKVTSIAGVLIQI